MNRKIKVKKTQKTTRITNVGRVIKTQKRSLKNEIGAETINKRGEIVELNLNLPHVPLR